MELYNRNLAFTLAEVLVTLGIIGIVAALTLPNLIENHNSKKLETQLKKEYSTFAQATQLIISEDFSSDMNGFADLNVNELLDYYQKYLSKPATCSRYEKCPAGMFPKETNDGYYQYVIENYTTYNGILADAHCVSDSAVALNDGSFAIIDNCGDIGFIITVDVNGWQHKPNRFGQDFFMFQLSKSGKFLPMGTKGTAWSAETYCVKDSKDSYNGRGCTSLALSDPNYFKKLP